MGGDVDGIGRVESEDLEDLSLDDAADLFGAGIHRACIRPPTELATFDELCWDNHQILNEKQHQILNERKTDLKWKVIKY